MKSESWTLVFRKGKSYIQCDRKVGKQAAERSNGRKQNSQRQDKTRRTKLK